MTEKIAWGVTKTDNFAPFETFDEVFEDLQFRIESTDEFSDQTAIYLTDEITQIFPQIRFKLSENYFEQVAESLSDPLVKILVRDKDLNHFGVVESIPFTKALDQSVVSVDLPRKRLGNYSTIELVVTLCDQSSERIDERTRVYGRKIFRIKSQNNAPKIPKKIVPAEVFEKVGLSRRTPWYLNWARQDVSLALTEVVEVWLNEEFEEQYRLLSGDKIDSAMQLFAVSMESQIMSEVIIGVLSRASDFEGQDLEEESALSLIKDFFENKLAVEHGVRIDDIEFSSKVRALCYQFCGFSNAMSGLEG